MEVSNVLSPVAQQIAEKRYFKKDSDGKIIEDWSGLAKRVVDHVCKNEPEEFKQQIYDLIYNTKFLPNTPCLVNAGRNTKSHGLSACYVTKAPEDTWNDIVENVKNFGEVARAAGGCGVSFSKIRPEGSPVRGSSHSKALGPIEAMRIVSEAMSSITQSGIRGMANMGTLHVSHPDVINFIKCKQRVRALKTLLKEDIFNHFDQISQNTNEQLHIVLDKFISNFNISVVVSNKFMEAVDADADWNLEFGGKSYQTIKARELFDMIAENAWQNGDPGLLFEDAVNDGPYKHSGQWIDATNPCVHGDTLVAVADGRNCVSIKQLAEEGKDIPVYCRNSHGSVSIRYMRRPRLSGKNQKLLKITIEGGHVIKVTENHKLVLSNGEAVEAKNIKINDSLSILTKLCAPFNEVIKNWNSKSQNYYWLNTTGKKGWVLDHRAIYNFYHKIPFSGGVVHHKDYNGLNNAITNLEYMDKAEHDYLHRADKLGDKNPMRRAHKEWSQEKWAQYRSKMSQATSGLRNGKSSGISNDELFECAVQATKIFERRISEPEWRKYAEERGLVEQFSEFRNKSFGSISDFLSLAAAECGFESSEYYGPILREYKKFLVLDTDMDIFFDGSIKVRKKCEACGTEFIKVYYEREIAYCSLQCSNNVRNKSQKQKQACINAMTKRREEHRFHLLNLYNELKSTIGEDPKRKDFADFCKKKNTSFRLPTQKERTSGKFIGCFGSWSEMKEQASLFNHKVIAIEEEQMADVYTGTVDDYHNFYIGHFEETHNGKNRKFIYINNLQCGEQPLPHYGVCNLGSLDVSKYYNSECEDEFDWNAFKKSIHVAVRFLDNVVDANVYPNDEFAKWAKNNRPIGLGIMGLADLLLKKRLAYGSKKTLEFSETLAQFLESESNTASIKIAKEKGTPSSCDYKELSFRRNVTLTTIAPTGSISLLAGCSSSIEPIFSPTIYRYDNTGQYVLPHPSSDKAYFRCAVDKENDGEREVTFEQHILMQAAFQKHGSSGVSKTINMPNSATIDDIKKAYRLAWETKCKGITVYRDGSKTTQVLNTKSKGTVGSSNAPKRPTEVPCDIFKARADGFDWHVIVGKVEGNPFEIFAVNGRVELPESGVVVKRKKKHYALLNEKGETLIDNLAEEEDHIDPRVGLESRRFSLELRHGIHPKYIVDQIDKSNAVITSFSKACGRIMKSKYIDSGTVVAESILCPSCAKEGKRISLVNEAGCWHCSENCGYSKCG